MGIRRQTSDQRCYDLAEELLSLDEEFPQLKDEYQKNLTHRLAGDIQGAWEDFTLADEMQEIFAKENADES